MYKGFLALERGERPAATVLYRQALPVFHRMLLLNLWMFVRIALGLVLLVVPGVYLFFSFQYANFILLDEPVSNRRALARSAAMFSLSPGKLAWSLVYGFLGYGLVWLASRLAGEICMDFFPREAAWCVQEVFLLAGGAWLLVYRILVYQRIAKEVEKGRSLEV
jgi:hypothetical protein